MSSKPKKKKFGIRSIKAQITIAFIIMGIIMLVCISLVNKTALTSEEEDMIASKELSDLNYMEDYLAKGNWYVDNGSLYKGYVEIGDCTDENANITPFVELEEKTGTFFYTFMKAELVKDSIRSEIESNTDEHSDYIRVAGSTRNAAGESIVGTYMSQEVSDYLAISDQYTGEANVEGTSIYCTYQNLRDSKGNVVGAIVVGRSTEELENEIKVLNTYSLIIVVIILIIGIFGMMMFINRLLKQIAKAKNYMEKIGEGEIPDEPLEIKTKNEMNEIAESLNEMADSLREKQRIGSELELARSIQKNMLPSIFPAFPNRAEFDVFATMNPAKEVGGDFYDFFMIDDETIAIVIGDVSGKGVPAALFMAIAKSLIKNTALTGLSPNEMLTKVNQMLCEGNEAGLFVTCWVGYLNLAREKLVYANAGHNPPLVYRAGGSFEYLKCRPGFVLAGMDSVRYRKGEIEFHPGDRIFIYTDGVTEAINSKMELYGEDRLLNYINNHYSKSAEEILYGLKENLDIYAGETEQFDDITMLMLDYISMYQEKGVIEKPFKAIDSELTNATAFVEEELEKIDCPPKAVMQISIALEEIFVNIAHYAYSDRVGYMRLAVIPGDGEVTIRFKDRGLPFDPLAKDDPDVTMTAEERRIGGLGIYMVKKSMDNVKYEYKNGQNIFCITKKF